MRASPLEIMISAINLRLRAPLGAAAGE